MPDLIPPHGGVAEPINRTASAAGADEVRSLAKGPVAIPISDADLSTLYRIGDGGLSPLTGPMNSEEYNRVLDEEVIVRDGKKYAWTIPLSFPVSAEQARTLKPGQTVALVSSQNQRVASLDVSDVFPWDKARYVQGVYGTSRWDHPGGQMVQGDSREYLLGGEVRVLPHPANPHYGQFVLSPKQTRE